jgi:hypothetical protein
MNTDINSNAKIVFPFNFPMNSKQKQSHELISTGLPLQHRNNNKVYDENPLHKTTTKPFGFFFLNELEEVIEETVYYDPDQQIAIPLKAAVSGCTRPVNTWAGTGRYDYKTPQDGSFKNDVGYQDGEYTTDCWDYD